MEQRNIDAAVEKAGGRFKLSVLWHKRIRELVKGAMPLVPVEGKFNPMDVALQEILAEKIHFTKEDFLDADILGIKAEKEKERKEKEKEDE